MEYNDFRLPSDDYFKLMQDEYNKLGNSDRKTCLSNLFLCLQECKTIYFGIDKLYNKAITDALNATNISIDKTIENISNINNLPEPSITSIRKFNIFSYIKKLTKATKILTAWSSSEKKDYYRKLANSTANEFLENINLIICALEKSEVRIYKFM